MLKRYDGEPMTVSVFGLGHTGIDITEKLSESFEACDRLDPMILTDSADSLEQSKVECTGLLDFLNGQKFYHRLRRF